MRVDEAMTRNVCLIDPEMPIAEAAARMAEFDTGFLPVGENDRLVGTLTDRDLAVRALAQGKGPDAKVREVMTMGEVHYCFVDDELEATTREMGAAQVRRLPVLDRDKRLVGVISLGDLSRADGQDPAGSALAGVSQRGGDYAAPGSEDPVRNS